jgi:hypothetical protein
MNKPSQTDIILYYKGTINFDNINELIHTLKEKMKARKVSYVVYKKILMLMIETLENIIRYRENFNKDSHIITNYPPEFKLYFYLNSYIIETSNAVLLQDIPVLEAKMVKLNKLDKKSIRDLYKATITNGQFSDKGGAGLGIIEMAKISDEKLQYSFSKIDDVFSYFALKLIVNESVISKKTSKS